MSNSFHPIDSNNDVEGITKRDWLAGMAMQGMYAGVFKKITDAGWDWDDGLDMIVEESYKVADAMILHSYD